MDQAADVAVSEAGRCELPTGDGVEEREVGWIVRAQGAEAAAVLDDGATDGIEELRAGGLVFDRGQGLEVGLVGALGSSAAETEYLLILCRDLGYLSPAAFDRLTADWTRSRGCSTDYGRRMQ